MKLSDFLRMVDEEVKRHGYAGIRWTLTIRKFYMHLEFATWDDAHLNADLAIDAIDAMHPDTIRQFVEMAIARLLFTQQTRHGWTWKEMRSPWETE